MSETDSQKTAPEQSAVPEVEAGTKAPDASKQPDVTEGGNESAEAKKAKDAADAAEKARQVAASASAKSDLDADAEGAHADAVVDEQLQNVDNSHVESADSKQPDTPPKDGAKPPETPAATAETPELKSNPKASVFSKERWGAAAKDLATGMVHDATSKNKSFFDSVMIKIKYFGLRLINAYTGPFWFDELSPEIQDGMKEKFGVQKIDDELVWGEGTEDVENILADIHVDTMLRAHFDGDTLGNFRKDEVLQNKDITVKDFKAEVGEITDLGLKEKCQKLIDSFPEDTAAKDDDKFYEYLRQNSEKINENLGIAGKVELMKKNDSELSGIKESGKELSGDDASFEYTKFDLKETGNKVVETAKISITKNSVKIGDENFKLSNPGAQIIKVTSSERDSDHMLGLNLTVKVGEKTIQVDNALDGIDQFKAEQKIHADLTTTIEFVKADATQAAVTSAAPSPPPAAAPSTATPAAPDNPAST